MKQENLVALLPMKANSERIPRKNFLSFHGKPLFRWILDTLLSISEIDRVVINTDARDILARHGIIDSARIQIRDRPRNLCGDAVSMNCVLANDIANVSAKLYFMTHTTNPLIGGNTIRRALKQFYQAQTVDSADSLFSVNRCQTRFYRQDGSAVNHSIHDLIPTQNLTPWYEENSNLYLFTAESFSTTNTRIGERPILFETPKIESIDIDTLEDWSVAEALAQYLFPAKGGHRLNK